MKTHFELLKRRAVNYYGYDTCFIIGHGKYYSYSVDTEKQVYVIQSVIHKGVVWVFTDYDKTTEKLKELGVIK